MSRKIIVFGDDFHILKAAFYSETSLDQNSAEYIE